MRFCKKERCRWYKDPSKYGRKCYYEPQCWRGYLDILLTIIRWKLRTLQSTKKKRQEKTPKIPFLRHF